MAVSTHDNVHSIQGFEAPFCRFRDAGFGLWSSGGTSGGKGSEERLMEISGEILHPPESTGELSGLSEFPELL